MGKADTSVDVVITTVSVGCESATAAASSLGESWLGHDAVGKGFGSRG
jgi:hypothetical protein